MYLAQNAEVTILDISNNNITPIGAEFIAKGMKVNVSLVTLRVRQSVGETGASCNSSCNRRTTDEKY